MNRWIEAQQETPRLSWDSPKIRAIIKASPRDFADAVRKQFSRRDLRELGESCQTVPLAERDRSDTADFVLKEMVRVYVDSADREGLVSLLSARWPGSVQYRGDIEYYLVFRETGLRDPITVLGEAYSECKIPQVRHEIAAAVRRGFSGLGVQGNDDAEFVKNAMQWYENNKDRIVVNDDYVRNSGTFGSGPDSYAKNPLFKKK